MKHKRWSEQELSLLRAVQDVSALVRLLPERTRNAIVVMRHKQGVRKWEARRWTPEEIERLRFFWRSTTPSSMLAHMPGRTLAQIEGKAKALGLTKNSTWAITLSELSRKTGFPRPKLKRILRQVGVTMPRYTAQRHWISRVDALAAVDTWLSWSTLTEHAARVHVNKTALRRMLILAGLVTSATRKSDRYSNAQVDQAIAAYRGEGAYAAARRLGVSYSVLQRALVFCDIVKVDGRYRLSPEQFDRVLADWNARKAV